jgi:branched-chain amino acid transport system substrate-binding protein
LRAKLLSCIAIAGLVSMACTRADSAEPSTKPSTTRSPAVVKIAFIEDLSAQDAPTLVAPAFQGARLGFDSAELSGGLPFAVDVVALDTQGDLSTATDMARQIAQDPAFVGAVAAPLLSRQAEIGDVLNAAGVPTISLSDLSPRLASRRWSTWRRVVATVMDQGRAIARFVDSSARPGKGACLAGDGTMASDALLRAVATSLREPVVLRWQLPPSASGPGGVTTAVSASGCGTVVWGGGPGYGALLRQWLVRAGLGKLAFVGGDAMKAPIYLSIAGGLGRRAVVACPCVDVSTWTTLPAQRFIQDYQASFGLPPGPYAVEAWDVAGMFEQAFRAGASSRAAVLNALSSRDRFDGLAGDYRFLPDGELASPSATVHLFRDEAGRWIPLPGPSIAHSG